MAQVNLMTVDGGLLPGSVWGRSGDGNLFFGYGVNFGIPHSVSAGINVFAGYLSTKPISPWQTNNFDRGYAGGGSALYGAIWWIGWRYYGFRPEMDLRRLSGSVQARMLKGQIILYQWAGVSLKIKGRPESGGSYGTIDYINTEDAHTKDRLVVLLHGDDELHRVCAVEEHLL